MNSAQKITSFSGLPARIATALFALPLIYLALRVGNPVLAFALIAIGAVASFETFNILKHMGYRFTPMIFVVCGATVVFMGMFNLFTVIIASLMVTGVLTVETILRSRNLDSIRIAFQGSLLLGYVSVPLALLTLLSDRNNGFDWTILALASVFMTDTCAYIFGRMFGRHAMAPTISPNKTWEGAIGGSIFGFITTLVMLRVTNIPWDIEMGVILAISIVIVAQFGDLFESKLKRIADIKDSGRIILGHGGILDRLDSLLPVFALIYYASANWSG